ncbi:MAG: FtsW/RodA/SpoVE family cell cycle protein, partial [Actinomycetota bacterium]|nr:FtsW/RodA/SpoVE family cell cycle protein [Actinomycetota bacterium]
MTAIPNQAAAPRAAAGAVPVRATRRGTELSMIGFAVGIMALAYAAVGLGLNGHVPSGIVIYVPGFAVLLLVAHMGVRTFAPHADPLMLPLAGVLNGLGIVMIYRLQESGVSGNPGFPISTLTSHA